MAHIRFQNVSKAYTRQPRQFFYRFLSQELRRSRRKQFYALRDVSFQVGVGRSLAVVGHNGAGKSTLLNLVAGLTAPEKGSVEVEGRVMALLELGSGFHQDLTGAENLRMNAALCGFTKTETEELLPQIVEFSELGEFIWEPLRTYSSGMVLRLAFSIAVHADADILLLDEVLTVGDKDFQQKCLARVVEMRNQGKILLCVSHVPELLHQLCSHALWIEAGRVVREGPIEEVLEAYQETAGTIAQPSAGQLGNG